MPKGFYPHRRRIWTPERDKLVSGMYQDGWTQKQIAKRLKTKRQNVRESLKRSNTQIRPQYSFQRGVDNPAWKGGRVIDGDGYVLIRMPKHPNARNGYVLEHRLVLERILNRYLTESEVVHHKNGDKTDNDPNNLILFANNGEHLGVELLGKCPKWSEDGLRRISERKVPSMKGTHQCQRGTGVRTLRKKAIQKFLHDTSNLENGGPVASLPPLPACYPRSSTKHGKDDQSSNAPE